MKKKPNIDSEYLKWSRKSTPQARLEWLADALEFAHAKKKIIKKHKK